MTTQQQTLQDFVSKLPDQSGRISFWWALSLLIWCIVVTITFPLNAIESQRQWGWKTLESHVELCVFIQTGLRSVLRHSKGDNMEILFEVFFSTLQLCFCLKLYISMVQIQGRRHPSCRRGDRVPKRTDASSYKASGEIDVVCRIFHHLCVCVKF